MQVLKLFRKYNHVLLMVFMSLLLVAFLVPEAIQGCRGGQVNEPIGQAFGNTIYQQDLRQADADLSIVGAFVGTRPFPPLEFYLLSEEARRLGVLISTDSIRESYEQAGLGNVVAELAQRYNISRDAVYQSLGRFSSVTQAYTLAQSALVPSAPRVRETFRNQRQQATIRVTVIPDELFTDQTPEPSEEELRAQFEAGKDRAGQHEDEQFVFGYRHDDRVQVEYLTVDPEVVERSMRVSRKEAEDFYSDNASHYVTTVTPAGPTTQPARRRETRQMGFEEALDQVRNDVRQRKAALAAQRLLNEIDREAQAGWLTAELDENRFAAPPADAERSWEELAERFSSRYPVIYQQTELLDAEELWQVPGLGRAAFGSGTTRLTFADMAQRVKGLFEPAEDDNGPRLALYQPSPVMTVSRTVAGQNMPWQTYIFRVIRVAPAAAPQSLDEVRAQVVEDVKAQKAHEIAGEYARKLAETARQMGLDKAVAQSEELVAAVGRAETAARDEQGRLPFNKRYAEMLGPFTPSQPLTREAMFIDTKLGYLGSLAEKVFAAGAPKEGEHSVVAVPMVPSRRWAVVEVLDIQPLYQGDFDLERAAYANQSIRDAAQTFQVEWFEPENIYKRTGYKPQERPDEPVE